MSWPKRLTVDKRIVLLLSASTYESFPRALRELVSNAYDADATTVKVDISEQDKTILVHDNGSGMTPNEFDFFLRIAGERRSQTRTSHSGRIRIGQFGIGFLAMFPFCNTVEIESTVAGSSLVFLARIPASQFFRSVESGSQDLSAALVRGEEYRDRRLRAKHFTRIKLLETTSLLQKYLLLQQDLKKYRNSIRSYPGLNRLKWELQDILPLPYPIGSAIAPFANPNPVDFNVILNGATLESNDFVDDVLDHSSGVDHVGKIRFMWAIGTRWRATSPDEARGLRVRLHRVGVGPRQYFDLNIAGRTFSRLNWLTGEVNIVSGLDEAITLDRDNFTQSQDYEDLREFFRDKLRKLAYFVEDVDEAKRKIKAQLSRSPRATIAPTEQVIEEQVKRLEKRGFTILPRSPRTRRKSAVRIDTEKRVVTVDREATSKREVVTIGKTAWNIEYERWESTAALSSAYKLSGENTIILNQDYPLFKGSHKHIFRRLQIMIACAEHESTSKREFIKKLQDAMLKQFQGLGR